MQKDCKEESEIAGGFSFLSECEQSKQPQVEHSEAGQHFEALP